MSRNETWHLTRRELHAEVRVCGVKCGIVSYTTIAAPAGTPHHFLFVGNQLCCVCCPSSHATPRPHRFTLSASAYFTFQLVLLGFALVCDNICRAYGSAAKVCVCVGGGGGAGGRLRLHGQSEVWSILHA